MCDIDKFKAVNDNYGHDTGNKLIVVFGQCLDHSLRAGDVLVRIGGEEFAILLKHTHLNSAEEAAERMRESTETIEVEHKGNALRITASFGVAQLENDSELLKKWLRHFTSRKIMV